jgi:hypothetical protein
LVALVGAVPLPAAAATDEAVSFTVRDVQVDVTADNVNVARQQAFVKGQRDAFDRLMQRFTTPDEAARLPQVTDGQIDDLVLDVGVDQEKRSTVRYIATLSVRFKPDGIRQLLHDAGIAFVEWRGPPVAVLPVLKTEGGPILWEANNPWRDAWKSAAAQGLVPLTVPAPPPADQAAADALQAVTAGPEVVNTFAARYQTQDVLVAVGVIGKTDDGRATFDATFTGAGPLAAAVQGTKSWQGEAGETLDSLLHRAVTDTATAMNAAFKANNMVPVGELTSMSVMVPISGLQDWTQLREKLARTTVVRSWDVGAISRSSASLVLHYSGQQPQLESMLVQNGLVLSWADDHWVLQVALARPADTNTQDNPPAASDAPAPAPNPPAAPVDQTPASATSPVANP